MLHSDIFEREERPPKLDGIELGRALRRKHIRSMLKDQCAHLEQLHTQLIVSEHGHTMALYDAPYLIHHEQDHLLVQ